jgi:hypothetical protein
MQGVVPNILKFSRITPEYKNGLTTDPTNYRPITLLSPFGKILEKIISDQLTSFIGKNEILFPYQFGFWKRYATVIISEPQLIIMTYYMWPLFRLLYKAFDTVNHIYY